MADQRKILPPGITSSVAALPLQSASSTSVSLPLIHCGFLGTFSCREGYWRLCGGPPGKMIPIAAPPLPSASMRNFSSILLKLAITARAFGSCIWGFQEQSAAEKGLMEAVWQTATLETACCSLEDPASVLLVKPHKLRLGLSAALLNLASLQCLSVLL